MAWLGIDVGGANVKVADGQTFATTHAFALWKQPKELTLCLRQLIAESPPCDHVVATMTGELADCFATKREGVQHILLALEEAAASRHLRVYTSDGRFVTAAVARRDPMIVAAANWHALACFAARFTNHPRALLVDVGSTTTDILPLDRAALAALGTTDTQRLAAGALLYTGVSRSPVCAVARRVPYRDHVVPLAQELFATMRDVYLLLGELPEDPTDCETADGRAATKAQARTRLGRMICAEDVEFHHKDAAVFAESVAEDHASLVAAALRPWLEEDVALDVIVSGAGEFLARRALTEAGHRGDVISMARKLGAQISHAATAHALAVLAREGRAGEQP
jgi:probable H4MPT-linked C1 transfer pathway protein